MESFYGTAMISMQLSGSSGRYSEVRGVGLQHRGPNPGAYLASAKSQCVDSTYSALQMQLHGLVLSAERTSWWPQIRHGVLINVEDGKVRRISSNEGIAQHSRPSTYACGPRPQTFTDLGHMKTNESALSNVTCLWYEQAFVTLQFLH